MAQLAAELTQAYELLTDPERKAALDAQLKAEPALRGSSAGGVQKSQVRSKSGALKPHPAANASVTWALRIAVVIACALFAWKMVGYVSKQFKSQAPMDQLSEIRAQMEGAQISEAERRALFSRKQSLLEAHADLAKLERTQRINDLAQRSIPLLEEPLMVSLADVSNVNLPPVRLAVPEITLVLGSFDAVQLKQHVARHRQRMVLELQRRLSSEPAMLALSADSEQSLKRVIRESVTASLELRLQETYPSTYFESPGRHGVVDVILPQSFGVLR